MSITGFDIDNQRIAKAHNEILIELVKAIRELTKAIKEGSEKEF